MTRDEAARQISDYVTGWTRQDKSLFLRHLSANILIRECYGPEYVGRTECDRWFEEWHRLGGRVFEWKILRITYDETEMVASVDWDFRCWADEKEHAFFGASHVVFDDTCIRSIDEYRMDKDRTRPYQVR